MRVRAAVFPLVGTLLLACAPGAGATEPGTAAAASSAAAPPAIRLAPVRAAPRIANAVPGRGKVVLNPADTRSLPGRMPRLAPVTALPNGFEPAPTPNLDLNAPAVRSTTEAQVGATLTRRAQGFGSRGDGFSPGSSYSGYFDRRGRATEGIGSTLAPSLQLRVPLE